MTGSFTSICVRPSNGSVAGKDVKLSGKEGGKEARLEYNVKKKIKSDSQKRKLSAVVSGDEFDDDKRPRR